MINRRKARILLTLRRVYRSAHTMLIEVSRALISRRRIITFSSLFSFIIIALSYVIDSSPYPLGGEVTVGQWLERFRRITQGSDDNVPDSICLINVAFDKALVNYDARLFSNETDSPTLPAGTIATTDRRKLLRFLSIADSLHNYKYILLDIRFEDDIETDLISNELFSLIGRMDNIVFAIHENCRAASNAPLKKAAYGDYHTTFLVTDVVKYPLLKFTSSENKYLPSIPAKMYSDLNDKSFTTNGLFTFCDNQLCNRSVYPSFPIRLSSWARQSESSQYPILQYYNLGEDLINIPNNESVISDLIGNKIVVIGDFIDDIHDTYIGPQPGALVNLNAYIALCKGEHLIRFWGVVCQFFIYFFITWGILRKKSFIDFFPKLKESSYGFLKFILSFVGYSTALIILASAIYIVSGAIFSIALPSLFFSLLESCQKN